jgi:tRNA-specific 2-thiouridylase
MDVEEQFTSEVIENFLSEYHRSRTPNPCVRCNTCIRFQSLRNLADRIGFRYVATGHYARICRDAGGTLLLARARSAGRDQSYFLCGLHGPSVLGRVLFPLGERDKIEARSLARRGGLAVEGKRGSQEVCFMAGASLKAFVTGRIPLSPGKIENTRGEIIGEHKGLALYTIGQRRKLGVATGARQYVVGMDAIRNVLIIGGKNDLLKRELRCTLSWLDESALAGGNGISAQIRSRHPAAPLREMDMQENTCRVTFAEPQSALTPGQTIAFYKGDLVVGSGVIDATGPF